MSPPEGYRGTGQLGKAVRATLSSMKVDAIATRRPKSPGYGQGLHGMVEEGRSSSLEAHVVERKLGLMVGYLARELEQCE